MFQIKALRVVFFGLWALLFSFQTQAQEIDWNLVQQNMESVELDGGYTLQGSAISQIRAQLELFVDRLLSETRTDTLGYLSFEAVLFYLDDNDPTQEEVKKQLIKNAKSLVGEADAEKLVNAALQELRSQTQGFVEEERRVFTVHNTLSEVTLTPEERTQVNRLKSEWRSNLQGYVEGFSEKTFSYADFQTKMAGVARVMVGAGASEGLVALALAEVLFNTPEGEVPTQTSLIALEVSLKTRRNAQERGMKGLFETLRLLLNEYGAGRLVERAIARFGRGTNTGFIQGALVGRHREPGAGVNRESEPRSGVPDPSRTYVERASAGVRSSQSLDPTEQPTLVEKAPAPVPSASAQQGPGESTWVPRWLREFVDYWIPSSKPKTTEAAPTQPKAPAEPAASAPTEQTEPVIAGEMTSESRFAVDRFHGLQEFLGQVPSEGSPSDVEKTVNYEINKYKSSAVTQRTFQGTESYDPNIDTYEFLRILSVSLDQNALLTPELVEAMGGVNSTVYKTFLAKAYISIAKDLLLLGTSTSVRLAGVLATRNPLGNGQVKREIQSSLAERMHTLRSSDRSDKAIEIEIGFEKGMALGNGFDLVESVPAVESAQSPRNWQGKLFIIQSTRGEWLIGLVVENRLDQRTQVVVVREVRPNGGNKEVILVREGDTYLRQEGDTWVEYTENRSESLNGLVEKGVVSLADIEATARVSQVNRSRAEVVSRVVAARRVARERKETKR